MMTTKTDSPQSRRSAPKPYQKPTLITGPLLTKVTAQVPLPVSGTPAPACWVARAAFGEADIRWLIFRGWLLEDAPVWFRRLYLRHGEAFGSWLTGRRRARGIVRTLMLPAIRRKAKS
jgi:hypothetical protein